MTGSINMENVWLFQLIDLFNIKKRGKRVQIFPDVVHMVYTVYQLNVQLQKSLLFFFNQARLVKIVWKFCNIMSDSSYGMKSLLLRVLQVLIFLQDKNVPNGLHTS